MTPEQEIRRFIETGDHDPLYPAWSGDTFLEKAHKADNELRTALIQEVKRRAAGRTPPPVPEGHDAGRFVLGRVTPMVRGLFPAKEQQVILDLLEKGLVFVSHENIDALILEIQMPNSAWKIANLYLGSLGLPGLDGQPANIVGFSEEVTFYVSTTYFHDDDPFADWVVHEAAHVFHNWKRKMVGLPHTRTREFLLPVAFRKRELFAYACEAYARIVERAKGKADRLSLHQQFAAHWSLPSDDLELDLKELKDVLAEAVTARNGWKRILHRCSQQERRSWLNLPSPSTPASGTHYGVSAPLTIARIRARLPAAE